MCTHWISGWSVGWVCSSLYPESRKVPTLTSHFQTSCLNFTILLSLWREVKIHVQKKIVMQMWENRHSLAASPGHTHWLMKNSLITFHCHCILYTYIWFEDGFWRTVELVRLYTYPKDGQNWTFSWTFWVHYGQKRLLCRLLVKLWTNISCL